MPREFLLLFAFLSCVFAERASPPAVTIKRNADLLESYDYIVVGGGLTGLVVANRLTENPSTTVLVIEAGDIDKGEDGFYVPGDVGSTLGTSYDWQVPSLPQEVLVNGNITIPLGKVVGGGSALNGMLFDRGSPADYNAWEKLGNPGWGWSGMLPYFKKSEIFSPPSAELLKHFNITWDSSIHGYNGSIHSSYPPFIYQQTKNFIKGMNQLGVKTSFDQGADAVGVFYVPNSLDPTSMTRSFAKPEYHDKAVPRPNYHLLKLNQVTRILTKKKGRENVAYGVEYAASRNASHFTIKAKVEVILAAGAIHTPQLLQLSGIGPKAIINALEIDLVKDIPGVGSNFQDHPSLIVPYSLENLTFSPLNWTMDPALQAYYRELYETKKEGPYTVSAGNALAFISTQSFSSRTQAFVRDGKSQNSTYLSDDIPPTIIRGYNKQREVVLDLWGSDKAASMEFSLSAAGPLVISLQHQLSRGDIRAASKDPFTPPAVNWRAMTNPLDLEIMIDAFKAGRELMKTPAIQELKPVESVTSTVTTDAQILQYLKETMSPSFAHVSCTCPMMPLSLGGVVDPELKVYGFKNLRIVDASIIPVIPATHIQATMYAIAEKAADIIKSTSIYS